MKKVLLLTRFRGEYEPTRIKKEALVMGWEIDLVNYEHIRVGVSEQGTPIIDLGNDRKIEDYDLVIPRAASARGKQSMVGVKTIILEYVENLNRLPHEYVRNDGAEKNENLNSRNEMATSLDVDRKGTDLWIPGQARNDKIRVLNGESFKMYPLMGKLEQGVLLAQSGLPVIPFSSFNGKKGWKKYLEDEHSLPVMVKMRFGSHGKNVKLAETEEKLITLSQKYSDGTVLIQPVVKVRRWYRVIVLGGKVLGMMKHKQKDKFQTEEQKEELSSVRPQFTEEQINALKTICEKACEVFKCDYAGLDVAWDEDKQDWVIFEINRTAQFKWFEKAFSEINVAKEILLIK